MIFSYLMFDLSAETAKFFAASVVVYALMLICLF